MVYPASVLKSTVYQRNLINNDRPKRSMLPRVHAMDKHPRIIDCEPHGKGSPVHVPACEPLVLIRKCKRDPHDEYSSCGHKSMIYLVTFLEVSPKEYTSSLAY
jgi:hypothetical protein